MKLVVILDYYAQLSRHKKSFRTGYKDRNLFVPFALLQDVASKIDNIISRLEDSQSAHSNLKCMCRSVYMGTIELAAAVYRSETFVCDYDELMNVCGCDLDTLMLCLKILRCAHAMRFIEIQTELSEENG